MRPSAVKIFCLFRLLSVKKAVSYFFLTVVDRPYLCRYEVQAQNELSRFFICWESQTRLKAGRLGATLKKIRHGDCRRTWKVR
jgi:hypothetical protein